MVVMAVKNSGKRGSKKAGSKKSRKTHLGSRNARPRPGRDEYDRFRSSSVGKSLSSSTAVKLSTGSSSTTASSSSCQLTIEVVSSQIVRKRKRPRLRNRFQHNKQQQKARDECKALVDEVFRISRISVDGLSRAESSLRRQYDVDLGRVTFKLMQSLQNKSSVQTLLNNNIMLALGKILAPKIDANGNTIIPHTFTFVDEFSIFVCNRSQTERSEEHWSFGSSFSILQHLRKREKRTNATAESACERHCREVEKDCSGYIEGIRNVFAVSLYMHAT